MELHGDGTSTSIPLNGTAGSGGKEALAGKPASVHGSPDATQGASVALGSSKSFRDRQGMTWQSQPVQRSKDWQQGFSFKLRAGELAHQEESQYVVACTAPASHWEVKGAKYATHAAWKARNTSWKAVLQGFHLSGPGMQFEAPRPDDIPG
jgi:hypothetical protein